MRWISSLLEGPRRRELGENALFCFHSLTLLLIFSGLFSLLQAQKIEFPNFSQPFSTLWEYQMLCFVFTLWRSSMYYLLVASSEQNDWLQHCWHRPNMFTDIFQISPSSKSVLFKLCPSFLNLARHSLPFRMFLFNSMLLFLFDQFSLNSMIWTIYKELWCLIGDKTISTIPFPCAKHILHMEMAATKNEKQKQQNSFWSMYHLWKCGWQQRVKQKRECLLHISSLKKCAWQLSKMTEVRAVWNFILSPNLILNNLLPSCLFLPFS